jgi:lipoprotein-anchoring transpeptidase ErfK/SrfK
MVKTILIYLTVLIIGFLFFVTSVFFVVPVLQESTFILPSLAQTQDSKLNITVKEKLEKEIKKLQLRLDKFKPSGAYIIINTSNNHFYLYNKDELLREGVCSTGKNERLVDGENKKEYVFVTPFGVRTVQSKQPNPVWAKPDWAFIEEGLPIPPPGDPSRFDSVTLGAYKLVLGDGYMIHGTIYKRFMGQNVTHGCIRMLDEDLEAVYKTLNIGSKVYIF